MDKKIGLYKKISEVMKDVEYLSKDDKIEFGKTRYKAISEEKVTSTVRSSLLKHGLVIFPTEQQYQRVGTISSVNVTYKIVDIETGQYELLASSGEGSDTQDKGVGKAMTYAYKYMMLRTFSIPTGEDPDKISSAELDEKEKSGLTDNQINALLSLAKRKGHSKASVLKAVAQQYGMQDLSLLTPAQYASVVKGYERLEDK